MKRKVFKLVVICFVWILLIGIIVFENRKKLWNPHPQLFFVVEGEEIKPWYCKGEDTYYVFLPAYARVENTRLSAYSEKWYYRSQKETDYTLINESDFLRELPVNIPLICKQEDSERTYQMVMMQSANLPTLYLDTYSDSLHRLKASKQNREGAEARLYNEKGEMLYDGGIETMKGRGNTSFNSYEKKPWNISLEKAADLFGMGYDTEYVLTANASDPTLVRNDYARRLEQALEIPYVKVGQFVDLYINEEYQGNYYLCSPIDIGKNRLSITNLEKESKQFYDDKILQKAPVYENIKDGVTPREDEEVYEGPRADLHNKIIRKGLYLTELDEAIDQEKLDVTGGYLFERDYEHRFLLEYDDAASAFVTKEGECFGLKSPKNCSVKQIEYIASFVDEVEQSIVAKDGIHPETGKSYTDYIDLDSFAKRYLAEEITKNYDGGVSSTYFYKDIDSKDDRLHMAPGWDYDMSSGNYVEWMAVLSENPEELTKLSSHAYYCFWFEALYDKPEFYGCMVSHFERLAVPFLFEETEPLIEWYKAYLGASIQMNHVRWGEELENNPYYQNIDQVYEDFREYITRRAAFLKKEWSKE